jgi:HlyD family secretion protein
MLDPKRRWRWILPLLAVSALLAYALQPRAVRVDVTPLSRGSMQATVDEEGRTQVKRRYVVSAPMAGRLLRIELTPGDRVTEGAVLARLVPADAPLLDPRTRSELEARLRAAEAARAQADASVARARIAVGAAQDDLARKRMLSSGDAISSHDLTLAESEAAARAQELAQAEFARKVSGHQLDEARAALARGRSGLLETFDVVAPAAGQVLRVMHESEGVVASGTALLEVGDPAALEIAADLLTVDAVRVRPGMPALIDHWGGPRPLAARVRYVEPSGFTKLSALGVEEQRVRVVLDLVDPATQWQSLGDNFRVEVHVVTWQGDSVLRVPALALFRRADGWAAFVVDHGRLRERRLEVGEQSPEAAEVRGGATEGELVVLRPGESLREGMRVAPVVVR